MVLCFWICFKMNIFFCSIDFFFIPRPRKHAHDYCCHFIFPSSSSWFLSHNVVMPLETLFISLYFCLFTLERQSSVIKSLLLTMADWYINTKCPVSGKSCTHIAWERLNFVGGRFIYEQHCTPLDCFGLFVCLPTGGVQNGTDSGRHSVCNGSTG